MPFSGPFSRISGLRMRASHLTPACASAIFMRKCPCFSTCLARPSHVESQPPAEFEAVNIHFSARSHTFFNALRDLADMSRKKSPDELDLIRQDDGLWAAIRIVNQSFDIYPDCLHRTFHTCRLSVRNPDSLPLLNRVIRLRVLPEPDFSSEPDMIAAHMRPVCPRVPLELAARLPRLRDLDCPWLWERFSIIFSSHALRRYARVWEGPWRDARGDLGQGVRHAMPSLPSSLTKARLWFWKPNPRGDDVDQAAPMPDLVGASSSPSSLTSEFEVNDPVSLGLRILGSRLEELEADMGMKEKEAHAAMPDELNDGVNFMVHDAFGTQTESADVYFIRQVLHD